MQNLDDEIEDGEISEEHTDDTIETFTEYRTLERPSFTPAVPLPTTSSLHNLDDSSQSSSSSSSSDSSTSSDYRGQPAKKRKKLSNNKAINPKPTTGKSNIWSSVLFEDHIERELKDIDVKHSKDSYDRSRDVESYNYPRGLSTRLEDENLDEESEIKIRKTLKHLDKKDGGKSFGGQSETPSPTPEDFEQSLVAAKQLLNSRKRKMDQRDSQKERKPKKELPMPSRVKDLIVTTESSPLEVAKDIALKLYEEKTDLIQRAVEIVGIEASIQLFKQTQEAENDGGILVANGSRRRTPGGVFFYLLRNHEEIPMEKIKEVFAEEEKARNIHRLQVRAKRRQEQAEKLKKSVQKSRDALPPLPTRSELELQQLQAKQEAIKEELDQIVKQEEVDDDENLVDINFECE